MDNTLMKSNNRYFIVNHKKFPLGPMHPFWYKFQVVSASFRNFLPSLVYSEHEPNFFRLLLNQRQTYFEQSLPSVPNNLKVRFHGCSLRDIRDRPGVISTFHSGSFRVIGHGVATFKARQI
ncbi:hypothetical protein H8S90_24215 [Olivibacter sp. SDN3]|uniref:hypothetical protein n=1 Tax=Olivibacter sp. SDN3 TaxID=2764720 RepID=UPI001650DA25|nr:hypothetical protein [Olivibacter sp. SDN3]QNL49773.1 hypothetical protein H8S90_24215 [Olivibacter sp. SDN3]